MKVISFLFFPVIWLYHIIKLPATLTNLAIKLVVLSSFLIGAAMFFSNTAQAECIGKRHIPFTEGNKIDCLKKAKLKEIRRIEQEYATEESQGASMSGLDLTTEKPIRPMVRIGYDKLHALSFSWGLYYLPSEIGYTKQGINHFAPSDITYHYYVNPSWSVGVKYQAYKLYGQSFLDGAGNPLGSDTIDIMRFWGHGTFHFDINDHSQIYTMVGVNLIDDSTTWINGTAKEDGAGSDQFLFEIAYVYFVGSNQVMAGLRFIDAPNGSENFNTWHNLGATEIFIGLTLGIF